MTDQVKAVPKFNARDFGVAEFKRTVHHLTLTEAQAIADVSNPRLWGDLLGKMVRGDVLEAFKPDTGDFAKFIVCESGPGFIRLGQIESYEPATIEVPDGALGTKWNVGKRSHDVIRLADNFVMASGFQTKDTAVAWIADHAKKVAA